MTQFSAANTTQQSLRKLTSHSEDTSILHKNYSAVRETVRKFDMRDKVSADTSLQLAPRPNPLVLAPTSSRPFIPIPAQNNTNGHGSETSSSIDSINSDNGPHQNSVDRTKLQSNDGLIKNLISATNPSKLIVKSTANRRRTTPPPPPPVIQPSRDNFKLKSNIVEDSIYVNHDSDFDDNEERDVEDSGTFTAFAKPAFVSRDFPMPLSVSNQNNNWSRLQTNGYQQKFEKSPRALSVQSRNGDIDSIRLEENNAIMQPRRYIFNGSGYEDDRRDNMIRTSFAITDSEQTRFQGERSQNFVDRRPAIHPSIPPVSSMSSFNQQEQQRHHAPNLAIPTDSSKRYIPVSNFMIEIGALLVVFALCMVLVLAIREEEKNLRTTMQLVYSYFYVVCIVWMIWCTFDIMKFRRQWMKLTAPAHNHDEYMDIAERHPQKMFYYPDSHNTGGLFMRFGAGIFCMGGLILTIIELSKTVTTPNEPEKHRTSPGGSYSLAVVVTKSMTYILRFLFHCVQFTFIFRYGNLIINHHSYIAKIGLIHLIIANFCTWFEAIVFETLEQIHKNSENPVTRITTIPSINSTSTTTTTTTSSMTSLLSTITDTITTETDSYNSSAIIFMNFAQNIRAGTSSDSAKNASTYEIISQIESTMNTYLYPFLIEYSLISLTVFFIMWKNVGKTREPSLLRFGDRHIFTVNCSRASRGLLIGGIILLVTILTLIPTYLLDSDAISVTHITELVLLIASLFIACTAFLQTTKLYFDPQVHVDDFDRVLILITTVGDFAYSFFGLFASIFVDQTKSKLPIGVEISIGLIAIIQTFLQSGFILDALHRRVRTKEEARNKSGRESVTALLLVNLAIWLHDSLSAKKVLLNPVQVAYYDAGTWAIIQAFTSPLSIFYRFHSSVCLADIWQEVYCDHGHHGGTTSGGMNGNLRPNNTNVGQDNED